MARWRAILAVTLLLIASSSADDWQLQWREPVRELQVARTPSPVNPTPTSSSPDNRPTEPATVDVPTTRPPADAARTPRPTQTPREPMIRPTEPASVDAPTTRPTATEPTPTTVTPTQTPRQPVNRPTEPATIVPTDAPTSPNQTPTPTPNTEAPTSTTKTPEPTTKTPEPTTETPEPTTKTPEPSTTVPEPTTTPPVPVTTPEPTSQTREPTPQTPEPTTSTPEPTSTTGTPEPTMRTEEPRSPTPEPTIQTPEPTLTTPEPTTTTPAPTMMTPEPTTETPEPTTKTPEPTFKTPKPSSPSPEPRTQRPQPPSPSPEPTTPTPESTTAAPEAPTRTPVSTTRIPEPTRGPRTQTPDPTAPAPTGQPATTEPPATDSPSGSPTPTQPEPTRVPGTSSPVTTPPVPTTVEPTTAPTEALTDAPTTAPTPAPVPTGRTESPPPVTRAPPQTPSPTTAGPTTTPAPAPTTDDESPSPVTRVPEATPVPSATTRTPDPGTRIPVTTVPATRVPATPEPTTTTPMTTTRAPGTTTAGPAATTSTPDVTTKAPEATTEAPKPTTKAPEATPATPAPTSKPPATPAVDPESPPPPPSSLTPAPVTTSPAAPPPTTPAPARTTSAPTLPPVNGNDTTAAPTRVPTTTAPVATRTPRPTPAIGDEESPPPVTRLPSATTAAPRTMAPAPTPSPISFDKKTDDPKEVVGTVKPANETNDQAFKKDVTVFNSSSPMPTPLDKFALPTTTQPTTRPQVFDVKEDDESEETEQPQKYVRGQVILDPETGEDAVKKAVSTDTNNDGVLDSFIHPNIIGGRSRDDPVNSNVMSTASANLHDMMRYSGCAFAGISLSLLLFFQYVSVDPKYTSAWANNRMWAPNTWEFLLYIGYLQQMGSISQLSLIKAPYFLWDYTDSYSWTNFLVQPSWESSKSTASDGDGINEGDAGSRRLATILIGGVVAFADRLGIKEQAILLTCSIALGIVVGVLILAYVVTAIMTKRSAERYDDNRSTQVMFAQSRHVHRMRNRSARLLGIIVLLWFTALYPLSTFASFEITMQIQSADITAGPLMLAIGVMLVVCVGGLAVCVRALWFKSEQELDEVNARGVWAPLCDHFNYAMRLFFFFGALCQIVTGIMVGTTDAEPGQLLAVIAVQLIYGGLVFVFSPFRASFTRTMTFCIGAVKVLNFGLAFAFMYSNKSLSSAGRRRCAEVFIGINSVIIVLFFVRHLGVFVAFLRVYGAASRRDVEWQSPVNNAALGPIPTAHYMPSLKQQYAMKHHNMDAPVRGASSRETRPVPWELESLPDDMTSAMMQRRGVSVVI